MSLQILRADQTTRTGLSVHSAHAGASEEGHSKDCVLYFPVCHHICQVPPALLPAGCAGLLMLHSNSKDSSLLTLLPGQQCSTRGSLDEPPICNSY